MSDQHSSSIKTPKQLLTIILLAFVVPVLLIVFIVKYVTGQSTTGAGTEAMTKEAIAQRLKPIGTVVLEGTAAPAAPVGRTGEQVVNAACTNCHAEGKGGAPKIGVWEDWKPRVAKGLATLTDASIKGHKGMPSRGGMAELTDADMRRAVEYMFETHSKPTASVAAPVVAAAAPVVAAAAAPAAKADAAAGEKLYQQSCNACHAAGVAGAPKTGDKAAWAPRIKTGVDAMVGSVLKGKGAMPPRGAAGNASDADIRAAVEYLVAQSK